ncbi:hypothetical protein FQN52_001693 [Onygenales sp. PD_12]|nr:hypothetical protein FQN52_001693 [Onygenales sp. PD_12]
MDGFSYLAVYCIICGGPIAPHEDFPESRFWFQEYRVVYRSGERVRLSGVGLREGPRDSSPLHYSIPVDPSNRWDDKDCAFTHIPVRYRNRQEYGYAFHEVCWRFLNDQYPRRDVSLRRLLGVLRSAPPSVSTDLIYAWGHGYQGLIHVNTTDRYPWDSSGFRIIDSSPTAQIATSNPCSAEAIEDLLNRLHLRPIWSNNPVSPMHRRPHHDPFARLPLELIEEIASYLPTNSMLSIRRVSRSFIPLLHSSTFWSTRFQPGGEREYVFAAIDKPKGWDWLSAYHQTNSEHISMALENKKRVWHLINILRQKIDLEWSGDSTLLPIYRSRLECLNWSQVHCLFMDRSPRPHPESDRSIDAQITRLPSHISQVGVSIVHDGNETYVGGMQFVSPGSKRLYLGYIMKEGTSFVDVDCVKGLNVSVGRRGVHALQVVGDNSLSPWLGCPDAGLKSRRLVFQDQIEVLKATFDGFKLLHLQAWGKKTRVPLELRRHDILMNHQMWFPDIPSPNMHMNELCFVGDMEITHPFQPMTYAQFGGPGGAYLPFLTGISVLFGHDDARKITPMIGIEFTYHPHAPAIPLSSQKLWPRPFRNAIRKIVRFDIDGPGGEYIEKVYPAVCIYPGSREFGHGLKVSTNWGRTGEFVPTGSRSFISPEPTISDAEVTTGSVSRSSRFGPTLPAPTESWYRYSKAEIAPGTVPTGFYACLDHSPSRRTNGDCFKGFGIISESVGDLVDKKEGREFPLRLKGG